MLVSVNKKSSSKIKFFLAYLKANYALTILEVTWAKVSTFECISNIDILVLKPSYVVSDDLNIDFPILELLNFYNLTNFHNLYDLYVFLLVSQPLALVGFWRQYNFK